MNSSGVIILHSIQRDKICESSGETQDGSNGNKQDYGRPGISCLVLLCLIIYAKFSFNTDTT